MTAKENPTDAPKKPQIDTVEDLLDYCRRNPNKSWTFSLCLRGDGGKRGMRRTTLSLAELQRPDFWQWLRDVKGMHGLQSLWVNEEGRNGVLTSLPMDIEPPKPIQPPMQPQVLPPQQPWMPQQPAYPYGGAPPPQPVPVTPQQAAPAGAGAFKEQVEGMMSVFEMMNISFPGRDEAKEQRQRDQEAARQAAELEYIKEHGQTPRPWFADMLGETLQDVRMVFRNGVARGRTASSDEEKPAQVEEPAPIVVELLYAALGQKRREVSQDDAAENLLSQFGLELATVTQERMQVLMDHPQHGLKAAENLPWLEAVLNKLEEKVRALNPPE